MLALSSARRASSASRFLVRRLGSVANAHRSRRYSQRASPRSSNQSAYTRRRAPSSGVAEIAARNDSSSPIWLSSTLSRNATTREPDDPAQQRRHDGLIKFKGSPAAAA